MEMFLIFAGCLFATGLYGILTTDKAIVSLMCIELMLNAYKERKTTDTTERPIFVNVSSSPHMVKGVRIADVPSIMAMIDMCLGETDR